MLLHASSLMLAGWIGDTLTKPVRFPCAVPLTTRELTATGTPASYETDTFLINCLTETREGKKFAIKRPGMSLFATYNGGGATNGQGTVFYKGLVFAMGSNTLYRITASPGNSTDGTAWTASTTAPWKARRNYGCVVFNGQILVMGGETVIGLQSVNDVWSSVDGVNWTQVTSSAPWAARSSFAYTVLGNTLYIMGGALQAGGSANDVWSTPDGVNWTLVTGSAAWTARLGHRAVTFNNGIYLMGGQNAALAYLNDVWFSTDGSSWTQVAGAAGIWGVRAYFSLLVYQNKLWVFGGTNGADLNTVFSSTDGSTWTATGNLPAVRSMMAACVYGNLMWLIGGSGTTTVWSTPDGAAFTVATAAYGGVALFGEEVIPFRVPISVNPFAPLTLWLIGGNTATSQIYRGSLSVAFPASFAIATAGATTDPFQFTTQNAGDYLVFKNTSDGWVFSQGIVQKITSANYPPLTVAGIVNLDDTVYVMDITGTIFGSNLSDPFHWSSLNFITAEYASDTGVRIEKYLNYVVAFKSTTIQFFYDAGRFPGSPLLPILNATAKVGCAAAGSVTSMLNTLVFMAQTSSQGRYIAVLGGQGGFTPTSISNPNVNRILNTWNTTDAIYSWGARLDGHDVYMITCAGQVDNTPLWSLLYDFTEDQWHIWQSATGGFFPGINYVTNGNADLIQDVALGIIYGFQTAIYQDNGVAFTSTGQLDKLDGGNNKRKFGSSVTVVGDRRASSAPNNVTISWSDDDNQTFSAGVVVDMTTERPRIPRPGSFFRRSYKFAHSSNNPLRLEAIELEIIGSA